MAERLFGVCVFGGIALAFAAWARHGLRTGVTSSPNVTIVRSESPILFWSAITVQTGMAVVGLYAAVSMAVI